MKKYDYPERLEIRPVTKRVNAYVAVPGSKSLTNRSLVLAAFGSRHRACFLDGALECEDSEVMVDSLRRLGFAVETDWDHPSVTVKKNDGPLIPAQSADLFVGNSGTTMRFLVAMVAAGQGRYRLDGTPRMRERPIGDLIDALRQLGVNGACAAGFPPVTVETNGLNGGRLTLRGDISSQFLSGLLLAAPFASGPVELRVDGPPVSQPYIDMTIRQMFLWGLDVETPAIDVYRVHPQTPKQPDSEMVEADASAASYFFAAAAITQGTVVVSGFIPPDITLQGDIEFLSTLERMGCTVERDLVWNVAHGGSLLSGIDVDMNAISDTVMTLAAVACFADGPTTIRNVAHIRHKECDRISALTTELRKLGVEVEEYPDGLKITPRPMHGAEIETYNDHRLAMSMALIGLGVPGVVIKNPGCVAKTYPGFWEDFQRLYI